MIGSLECQRLSQSKGDYERDENDDDFDVDDGCGMESGGGCQDDCGGCSGGGDLRLWLVMTKLKVDFSPATNIFPILMMERLRVTTTATSHISTWKKSDDNVRQIQILFRIQIIFRRQLFSQTISSQSR